MKKVCLFIVPFLLIGCVNSPVDDLRTVFDTYREAAQHLKSDYCFFAIDSCADVITIDATINDTLYVNGKANEIVKVDSFYVIRFVSDSILLYYDTEQELKGYKIPYLSLYLDERQLMDKSTNEFSSSIDVYFKKDNGYWYITKNALPVSLFPPEEDDSTPRPTIHIMIHTNTENDVFYELQKPHIIPYDGKYIIFNEPDEYNKFKEWYNR